ncbi:hypothetical protein [Leptolyngbya sp. 7M]|uniref:hypothetical protein n=1 Tax=Leptolyngbya sp. 7M TaxID=2812896 RepID=UPI001B8B9D1A|nr:hypothetical protein [Leptolyngbya sp. 7M]QYO65149.1 hypothetical protein JVX88_37620 [Leptolyngbya sp. 7M]
MIGTMPSSRLEQAIGPGAGDLRRRAALGLEGGVEFKGVLDGLEADLVRGARFDALGGDQHGARRQPMDGWEHEAQVLEMVPAGIGLEDHRPHQSTSDNPNASTSCGAGAKGPTMITTRKQDADTGV